MKTIRISSVLRKRWRVIVVMFLIGLGLAVGLTATQQRIYTSTSQLFVSTVGDSTDSVAGLAQGNSFAQQRVQSYIAAAKTDLITQPATAALQTQGISIAPRALARKLTATAPSGRVIVNLAVDDASPSRAAAMANALADSFASVVTNLERVNGNDALKITILQQASPTAKPSSPNVYLNIGIGVLGGLVAGLALAALREALDNTFKSPDTLAELTNLPVLGVIPFDRQATATPVAFRGTGARGQRAEAFRHLRTNLDFVAVGSHTNAVIAVTSAMPGEGKTSSAINIAATLAEGGQRVCLIEADLRKPTMAEKLGLVRDVGLTSVLIGKADVEDVLQNAGQNLAVMTSGELPPNPSELLRSDAFRELLTQISTFVDRVIIDAAPLLPVADGAEVAAVVDETLLAVRAGRTSHDQVKRALQTLANVGVKPVGTILSMTSRKGPDAYAYYDYYGDTGSREDRGLRKARRADPAEPADTTDVVANSVEVVPVGGTSEPEVLAAGEVAAPVVSTGRRRSVRT